MQSNRIHPRGRRGGKVVGVLLCAAVLAQLAACGPEVAIGAATVGAMQAEQARQAQAQKDKIVDEMKRAQDAAAARAASAADAAGS